jgi:coenzyme F420-reducing hydrogenase beta subunit
MKEKDKSNYQSEIESVISGGYCIGCGVCSAVSNGSVQVSLNELGMYNAKLNVSFANQKTEVFQKIDYVCPFTDKGHNETEISQELFPKSAIIDSKAGRYSYSYAGWVEEDNFRSNGSSGGMVSWFLCELLRNNEVDYVIHVKPNNSNGEKPLFNFAVSQSQEEIRLGSKSRYYPVSYSETLELIRETPGRYAVVGLPCFIKAIRLLSNVDYIFRERITTTVGLVCGHLKSAFYLDMMAWQLGIPPENTELFDFRKKIECDDAHNYGVEAKGKYAPEMKQAFARNLYGTNWGYGFFKYHACDFCDDVLAETADIVFGDAWIDQYDKDWRGTNIIVVRNERLNVILTHAVISNKIVLNELSLEDLIASQSGSFRHRRDGLSIRLAEKKRNGKWVPRKRVEVSELASRILESNLYVVRMKMSSFSHLAFQEALNKDDFNIFKQRMSKYESEYLKAMAIRDFFRGRPKRIINLFKTYAKQLLKNIKRYINDRKF